MRRCYYELDAKYEYYGGRGIRVCESWRNRKAFLEWALPRYSAGLTLDRIDNDKGYSPDNCRFVSQGINNCNRGKQSNNTSNYIGVTYRKAERNWEARIRYQKKAIYLGRFASAEEAAEARNEYIKEHGLLFPLQEVVTAG